MAVISRRHGFLFIQVPRTGCTAVAEKVLVPELDGQPFPETDHRDADGRIVVSGKHASLQQLLEHGLLSPAERASLLVFATVRNPFDSVVSRYEKLRGVNVRELQRADSWIHDYPALAEQVDFACAHSFDDWLEWECARPGVARNLRRRLRRKRLPEYYRGVDVVMRFESLQDDFAGVLRRLGVDTDLTIPVYNRTSGRGEYREYYSSRSRRLVTRLHAPVIDAFGYTF